MSLMKDNIVMYYHGGSKNHGCEAIIRSTAKLFNKKIPTYSMYPKEDEKYDLDKVVDLYYDQETVVQKPSLKYYISALQIKMFKQTSINTYFRWQTFFKTIKRGHVYLATGGDNYCYTDLGKLADYNELIKKRGGKTVLWGCSIEPDNIKGKTIDDLKRYDLIVARESLTVNALKEAGITHNVVCFPDPAFGLTADKLELPANFIEHNMVGINVSPLVISCENQKGVTLRNYIELINYILEETQMGIALIPHVVKEESDDYEVLSQIKQYFAENDRVVLLGDHNCQEIKGYISRCRFFVGARTHATIAAYSTGVPTLVVGYSIKARGIAKDLFGTYDNYVLPVQDLTTERELVEAFKWIQKNEENIKQRLATIIPEYETLLGELRDTIERLS